jgi:uncharacterized iron-regulated membrane protein
MATDTLVPERRVEKSRNPGGGLFRAFWRWHFYAAFIVAPVLLVLASTGLIYLFRFQLEPMMHSDVMKVEQPAGVTQYVSYEDQRSAVAKAYPKATIASMTEPKDDDRSTDFVMSLPDGSSRDAYVNPWTGEVLGELNPDTTLSGAAIRLHSNLMLGTTGDIVMELGACWAIVMALTGYYLFIRGRAARLRRKISGAAGSAMRSRHAVIGSVVGAGMLILLVSGLPWTGFWGKHAQTMATDHSTSMWGADPGGVSKQGSTLDESLPHSHVHEIPWAQGDSTVPESAKPGDEVSVANVDTAVAVADKAGLHHPLTIALPTDDKGVFSAISYAFHDPSREKTVHVDQYGGQVVGTYGFADYPALAKVVSQGIGLHEGRSFGLVSFWAAALSCLMVIFMCVSGPMMWWRRRPKRSGSVAAPRGRMPLRGTPLLAVGIVALGVFLPFFGITLLIALLLDQLVLRRIPRLQAWFNVV